MDWVCNSGGIYKINKNELTAQIARSHPLSNITIVHKPSSSNHSDPLTIKSLGDISDPLSAFANEEVLADKELVESKQDEQVYGDQWWSSRRLLILNRYSTNEKLSISTSFLCAGGETIKARTVVPNKTKYRLEQLDNFEEDSVLQIRNLSQQEYIQRIKYLNDELIASWNNDQRVKALKISIQCAKMLSDTSVLPFYPSQFILITDVLDNFGKLVYDRLKSKSLSTPDQMPHKIIKQRLEAETTTLNWYYKVSSIRELLPRIYLEISILKCYEFLSNSDFNKTLHRISMSIRGLGDPLVAAYTHCYLIRSSLEAIQCNKQIRANFDDFLSIYNMIFSSSIRAELNRQQISIAQYLLLYEPFLDYMLEMLLRSNLISMSELMKICQETKNSGTILLAFLRSQRFGKYVIGNIIDISRLVTHMDSEGTSKSDLLRALGSCVSLCSNILDAQQSQQLWQLVQPTLNSFTNPLEYINCIETWAAFVADCLAMEHINEFLKEVHQHLPDKTHYAQLQNILDKFLQSSHYQLDILLIQDSFFSFLELFHPAAAKVTACKKIFSQVHLNNINNIALSDALMHIGKILNHSVSALTVEDERRQITQLVCNFIRQIDYERDVEQQLRFYVEARANFSNLEGVYYTLVLAVNKLCMKTFQIVNGEHSNKTAGFLKACIAYCCITIPSIICVEQQLDLYLLTGQVALQNQCLGQADTCFAAGLHAIARLPNNSEQYLVSYFGRFLATLVVVPDSPTKGVLFFVRLLLETIEKFSFESHSSYPAQIYLLVLDLLYVQNLEEFPYHIPNVVSNDQLYGHDPKFIKEVNKLCSHAAELILSQLQLLATAKQHASQAMLVAEFFQRVVRYGDLRNEAMLQLAVKLWKLIVRLEQYLDFAKVGRDLKQIVHHILEGLRKSNAADSCKVYEHLLLRMNN